MPVHGFIGGWGTGKTYACVLEARRYALKYHVPVVSNLDLRYPLSDHIEVQVKDSIEEIMDSTDCILLLDEIGVLMPSRFYGKLLAQTAFRWAQLRKYRIFEVLWSTQSLARVDTLVRELTWDFTQMKSYRLLGFFGGMQFQGMSLGDKEKIGYRVFWLNKKAYGWYDTMAVIGNEHLLTKG
jgi:hypothetical protein